MNPDFMATGLLLFLPATVVTLRRLLDPPRSTFLICVHRCSSVVPPSWPMRFGFLEPNRQKPPRDTDEHRFYGHGLTAVPPGNSRYPSPSPGPSQVHLPYLCPSVFICGSPLMAHAVWVFRA